MIIYKAPNKKIALVEFEKFKEGWGKAYPGAIAVWEKNWKQVKQLYDYTNSITFAGFLLGSQLKYSLYFLLQFIAEI